MKKGKFVIPPMVLVGRKRTFNTILLKFCVTSFFLGFVMFCNIYNVSCFMFAINKYNKKIKNECGLCGMPLRASAKKSGTWRIHLLVSD